MKKLILFSVLAVVICVLSFGVVWANDWNISDRWPSEVRTYQPNHGVVIYDTATRSQIAPIPENKWAAASRIEVLSEMKNGGL